MSATDMEIVLQAFGPDGPGNEAERDYRESVIRRDALAEIQRRGLDVEREAAAITTIMAELRRAPEADLSEIFITGAPGGLWKLIPHVWAKTDPLDGERLRAWTKAARATRKTDLPTLGNSAGPGTP